MYRVHGVDAIVQVPMNPAASCIKSTVIKGLTVARETFLVLLLVRDYKEITFIGCTIFTHWTPVKGQTVTDMIGRWIVSFNYKGLLF